MNTLQRVTISSCQFSAAFHEVAKALHMADSTVAVLYSLRLFGGEQPLKELLMVAELPKQTVNSALRRMEKDGLVRTEPLDGKSRLVVLTSAGEALAERTVDRILRAEQALLDAWGSSKATLYTRMNEEYLEALRGVARDIHDDEAAGRAEKAR